MANVRSQSRIQKELQKWDHKDFTMEIISPVQWIVHFRGAAETIYEGEEFRLSVKFESSYPMEAPEVIFVEPYVPMHPHCYSNGHICLNILSDDWSPALTVRSICYSILSMLSSCQKKEWPIDNTKYTATKRGSPKDTNFVYHDDDV